MAFGSVHIEPSANEAVPGAAADTVAPFKYYLALARAFRLQLIARTDARQVGTANHQSKVLGVSALSSPPVAVFAEASPAQY